MDPTYIFNNLISKDYDNIVNNVYNDIENLSFHLDRRVDFDHKIIKEKMMTQISYLQSSTSYDITWLKVTRELIYYLSRKYTKLVIDKDEHNYNIIQVDTPLKIQLMLLYMIFFHSDSRSIKKMYSGVDFEFNERKIALCQIAFFSHRKHRFIWIFNPNECSTMQTKYLIKYFFTSKWIYKIVHGSDSLDIPYLFQDLFMNNHDFIYSFITHVIDTRFLCEYHKNSVQFGDKKCSIYDALLYFGTIDTAKYDELQHINKTIGHIYDIVWDVHNMSSFNLKYAAYDSLYLHDFYFDMLDKANEDTPELYNSYQYIVLITRFIFLEKWEISDLLARIKLRVDPINNYIIRLNNENITLISVFNSVIKDMVIQSPKLTVNISNLLDINYFRSSLMLLFKFIIYSILTNNFKIYRNKGDVYDEKISIDDVFSTLKLIHLDRLRTLVKQFYLESESTIMKKLSK